ncbi:UDP-glucose 6-dehydrogenase [bacterium]|nr:UDP-glucose 6-dehydrogenase [bacterium]
MADPFGEKALDKKITLDGVPVLNGAGVVDSAVFETTQQIQRDDEKVALNRTRINRTLNVVVIGTGYVGLVTGAILADQGSNVTCVDRDPAKLEVINRGESPIYEPGLEEVIQSGLKTGHLKTSTSIPESVATADIVFIAVGTPPSADGTPDLTAVMQVVQEVGRSIKQHITLVTKSTVPVGTGNLIEETLVRMGVDPNLYDVVSCPEFLREGCAVADTKNPDRIIIGVNDPGAETKLLSLFSRNRCPILVINRTSAELVKYASNAFLAVKISFINGISRICEQSGANVDDIAAGMGLDHRISPKFLQAGLGWGGSCFPKDVQGLSKVGETMGFDFEMLKAAEKINTDQVLHFVGRIRAELGSFSGTRVAILGLAFKPNTDDIRDAKSLEIIKILKAEGAEIIVHDPVAMDNVKAIHPDLTYTKTGEETVHDADVTILVTEWAEYGRLNMDRVAQLMRGNLIFDGRRFFRPEEVKSAGLKYFTIGS